MMQRQPSDSAPSTEEIRKVKTFTLAEETANPIERYMGRVVRRDLLRQLQTLPLPEPRNWDYLVFGSSVIQLQKPAEGLPFRRRARDLDITIIKRDQSETTTLDGLNQSDCDQAVLHLLSAISASGAAVKEGTLTQPFGRHSFRIQRYFTTEEIKRRLQDKAEPELIGSVTEDLYIELEVEGFCARSHLLPLQSNGNFLTESLIETAGQKIARSLSKEHFVLRDLVDLYNLYRSGLVDFLTMREPLRVVAIVWMGMKNLDNTFTREILSPTEDDKISFERKLGVSREILEEILAVGRGIHEIVFPGDPNDVSKVVLFRDEERFLGLLDGFDLSEAGRYQPSTARVAPELLLARSSTALDLFPSLESTIRKEHEICERVRRAARNACSFD